MNNNDNNALSPLETELLAALQATHYQLRYSKVPAALDARKAARAAIDKAENQKNTYPEFGPAVQSVLSQVPACETTEATKHRIAHNDGWHKDALVPECPACGRIARLEVYRESS